MTAKDYVTWAENVYGEYRPVMKLEVLNLIKDWPADFISQLMIETRAEHDDKYKAPPGLYFIEKSDARKDVVETQRQLRIDNRTKELTGVERPHDAKGDLISQFRERVGKGGGA